MMAACVRLAVLAMVYGSCSAGGPVIRAPTLQPSRQPSISPGPTITYYPTAVPTNFTNNTMPTFKPTLYPGLPSAIGGVPLSVIIEAAVLSGLFLLFGIAMGCGMCVHAKRRKKYKMKKQLMYADEQELKREFFRSVDPPLTGDEIEAKTQEVLPDKTKEDWDEEEEDEDEAANYLVEILLIVFPFLSVVGVIKMAMWNCFCKTSLIEKPKMTEEKLAELQKDMEAATKTQKTEITEGEEDDEDDFGEKKMYLDGFLIDSGPSKNEKYLSRAKANVVTMKAHPVRDVTMKVPILDAEGKKIPVFELDEAGNPTKKQKYDMIEEEPVWEMEDAHYWQQWPLTTNLGQHNCATADQGGSCERTKRIFGFIRDGDPLSPYGVGIGLYFKMLKVMISILGIISIFATAIVVYFWFGSAWDANQKSNLRVSPLFFTTAGSLGSAGFTCASATEREEVTLSCPYGNIESVEAYYGQPHGSCNCPTNQMRNKRTGTCWDDPVIDEVPWGKCTTPVEEYEGTAIKEWGNFSAIPCFEGQMWAGDYCCSDRVTKDEKTPDFTSLDLAPNLGCNSGTAQLIAQGLCRGQTNCTIPINSDVNFTYTWIETDKTPCASESFTIPDPDVAGARELDINVTMCSATLLAAENGADFSQCEAILPNDPQFETGGPWREQNAKKRKLLLRATCYSPTFKADWFRGGEEQTRAIFSLAAAYADCFCALILFITLIWMQGQERNAVIENDMAQCTGADYTVRLHSIPPHTRLDQLEDQLRIHFEDRLNTEDHVEEDTNLPPKQQTRKKNALKQKDVVVYDKPLCVVDINFGLNNQKNLKAMVKRGGIAKKLDLLEEKLELMKQRREADEKIFKQDIKVRLQRVKFMKVCEEVEKRTKAIQAKTAFITFASEEGYERCCRHYMRRYGPLGLFGQPKRLRFSKELGGKKCRVSTSYEPSDYIWEHLAMHPVVRVLKVLFSNIITVVLLLASFGLIAIAKGEEARVKLLVGDIDCSVYDVKDNPMPAGFSTAWEGRYMLNATSDGFDVLTRDRVVEDQFWDFYNLTDPGESGKTACYCEAVFKGTPVGLTPVDGPTVVKEVEFYDPRTNLAYTGCIDWYNAYTSNQLMTFGAVGAVVAVNSVLKIVLKKLVAFEQPETRTGEMLALALKLFYATLMNVGFLFLLIGGNFNVFTLGRTFTWTRALKRVTVMSGTYADFNVQWYQTTGTQLLTTLLTQIFVPQGGKFAAIIVTNLTRCLDRKCTTNMFITKKVTQGQLEDLYTGPRFALEERYAALLTSSFVTLMYAGGMPLMWICLYLTYYATYLADKLVFLRLHKLPPKLGADLAMTFSNVMPMALFLHTLFAMWSYSEPDIFANDLDFSFTATFNGSTATVANTTNATSSLFDGAAQAGAAAGAAAAAALEALESQPGWGQMARPLLHSNTMPHSALFGLMVVYYVLTRVLDIDSVIYMFAGCFGAVCRGKKRDDNYSAERVAAQIEVRRLHAMKMRGEKIPKKPKPPKETDPEKMTPKEKKAYEKEQKKKAKADEKKAKADEKKAKKDAKKKGKKDEPAAEEEKKEDAPAEEGGAPPTSLDDLSDGGYSSDSSVEHAALEPQQGAPTSQIMTRRAVHGLDYGDIEGGMPEGEVSDAEADGAGAPPEAPAAPVAEETKEEPAAPAEAAPAGDADTDSDSDEEGGKKKGGMLSSLAARGKGKSVLGWGQVRTSKAKPSMALEERNRVSNTSQAIQDAGGIMVRGRMVEGNADYMAVINETELTLQVGRGVLNPKILTLYNEELKFRNANRDTYKPAKRMIRGLVSYDKSANPDYLKLFALDTNCYRMYIRGQIQVTEEDYELEKGSFIGRIKALLGLQDRSPKVAFPKPDIADDMLMTTTIIGVAPKQVVGPRVLVNLKVPPPPENVADNFGEPGYDEWAEDWQFVELKLCENHDLAVSTTPSAEQDLGGFAIRVRLPKGLQHKKVPELQFEIPAMLQKRNLLNVISGLEEKKKAKKKHHKSKLDKMTSKEIKKRMNDKTLTGSGLRESQTADDVNASDAAAHSDTLGQGGAKERTTYKSKVMEATTNAEAEEEHSEERNAAAAKIQAGIRGKQERDKLALLQRCEAKTLQLFEGFNMTVFLVALVIADLVLSYGAATIPEDIIASDHPVIVFFSYGCSAYFLIELLIRYVCFARLTGCGKSCRFFYHDGRADWLRLLDLLVVVLDAAGIIVTQLNGGSPDGNHMKTVKAGRTMRIIKLFRTIRVLKVAKLLRGSQELTGNEPYRLQKVQVRAPKNVVIGNRIPTLIKDLARFEIQYPLYAKNKQIIQFHLPTVTKYHLGKREDGCHIVMPDPSRDPSMGNYFRKMASPGWLTASMVEDDLGITPVPKKSRSDAVILNKKKRREKQIARAEKELFKYYEDYSKHRVQLQLMAFIPEVPVKDFQNISQFDDDVVRYPDRAIMTLRDGFLFGDRLECKVRTSMGKLHGQQPMVHIPGLGRVRVRICASDIILVPGVNNIPIHARGVLPWSRRPLEVKQYCPETIHELTFDFPAILLKTDKRGAKLDDKDKKAKKEAEEEAKANEESKMKRKGSWFSRPKTEPADTEMPDPDAKDSRKAKKHGEYYQRGVYTQKFKIDPFMIDTPDDVDPDEYVEPEEEGCLSAAPCGCFGGKDEDDDEDDEEAEEGETKEGGGEEPAAAESSSGPNPDAPAEEGAADPGEAAAGPEPQTKEEIKAAKKAEKERKKKEKADAKAAKKAGKEAEKAAKQKAILDKQRAEAKRKEDKELTYMNSDKAQSILEDESDLNFIVDADDDWNKPRNRVLVPKVGKFDIHWPDGKPRGLILNIPAFKPNELPHPDIAKLLTRPAIGAVREGRKQIGWILFEMPSKRFPRVLLRLPAYVSDEAMAMSHIDPEDFASPWNPLNNDYYRMEGVNPDETAAAVQAGPKKGESKMMGMPGKKVA